MKFHKLQAKKSVLSFVWAVRFLFSLLLIVLNKEWVFREIRESTGGNVVCVEIDEGKVTRRFLNAALHSAVSGIYYCFQNVVGRRSLLCRFARIVAGKKLDSCRMAVLWSFYGKRKSESDRFRAVDQTLFAYLLLRVHHGSRRCRSRCFRRNHGVYPRHLSGVDRIDPRLHHASRHQDGGHLPHRTGVPDASVALSALSLPRHRQRDSSALLPHQVDARKPARPDLGILLRAGGRFDLRRVPPGLQMDPRMYHRRTRRRGRRLDHRRTSAASESARRPLVHRRLRRGRHLRDDSPRYLRLVHPCFDGEI